MYNEGSEEVEVGFQGNEVLRHRGFKAPRFTVFLYGVGGMSEAIK